LAGIELLATLCGAALLLAASAQGAKKSAHAKIAPLATYKNLGNFISIPPGLETHSIDRHV